MIDVTTPETETNDFTVGLICVFSAFILWGLGPLYFKQLSNVSAFEILAHRILWSVPFLIALLVCKGHSLKPVWNGKNFAILCFTSCLISVNWTLFIYGINSERIVETALGYYINPLVNVALGALFLGESFTLLKKVSITLAGIGVSWMVFVFGEIPYLALALAFSFGFYGLIRKKITIHPIKGLLIETLLLSPLCLIYLTYLWQSGQLFIFSTPSTNLENSLLLLAALITAFPLWLFTEAAKRLELSTIGIVQYIAPSLQLGLGVLVYQEPFSKDQAIAFIFIWSALLIFTIELIRSARTAKRALRGLR